VIKKSRFVFALGLVLALGVAGIAFADGASQNDAGVVGSVKPAKLDKKKYKPVTLFTGVTNKQTVDGTQVEPKSEFIQYGKNIKIDYKAGSLCPSVPPNGSTPAQAKAQCPPDSYLGSGHATVQFPTLTVDDVVVSVFRGPTKTGIFLHTYSPQLLAAAPSVGGSIVKSNGGYALSVPASPLTGGGLITAFNATITKSTKVALGRCKSKKFTWHREVTYLDGSSETADVSQPCKRKGGK
jgi:hypothetical protein